MVLALAVLREVVLQPAAWGGSRLAAPPAATPTRGWFAAGVAAEARWWFRACISGQWLHSVCGVGNLRTLLLWRAFMRRGAQQVDTRSRHVDVPLRWAGRRADRSMRISDFRASSAGEGEGEQCYFMVVSHK